MVNLDAQVSNAHDIAVKKSGELLWKVLSSFRYKTFICWTPRGIPLKMSETLEVLIIDQSDLTLRQRYSLHRLALSGCSG